MSDRLSEIRARSQRTAPSLNIAPCPSPECGSRYCQAARDRDWLLDENQRLSASLSTMDHFADVAVRVERRNNELSAENAQLRARLAAVEAVCDKAEASRDDGGPYKVHAVSIRQALATGVES